MMLPSPAEIRRQLPLSLRSKTFLHDAQAQARAIALGKTMRKVCVVGPCSIHERASAIEYAKRFYELAKEVQDTCFLIMRVYCEKSRTATGWKGLLYDPLLDGSCDIKTGLLWTRELLLLLADMGIPTAAEFVDPLSASYFHELITWGFIGARTSASQPHRQFASSLNIPIGFKNSTDGHLADSLHGVMAASAPHTFLFPDLTGHLSILQSSGNPHAHIVLRGAHNFTNYDAHSIADTLEQLKSAHLHQRLMVDCSHGNCQKQWGRQRDVFYEILHQVESGNQAIFGLMLESHLENGNQNLSDDPSTLKYAVSITDPCIDWSTTEELILTAHHALSPCLL